MNHNKYKMTDSEKKIFGILSNEPMISQKELAYRLGLSRSVVSVHISNLTKKGYIVGRGYVMSEYASIVVVGAANIDLYGKSKGQLLEGESNPGHIEFHPGGVSRNISENLARIGVKVNLITSICNDSFGEIIKKSCDSLGIDYSNSYFLEDEVSTVYMAVLDNCGEMKLGLADTTALDKMPVEHIISKKSIISKSEVIVIDASLPKELISYIIDHNKHKITIVDPVSIGKATKLKSLIGSFHTIKCNKNEAGYLSGVEIINRETLEQAASILMNKGIKELFVTLGEEGVYYQNEFQKGIMESVSSNPLNVTGAGDAFTAGIAYCSLSNIDIKTKAKFASVMSSFSLESMKAVNPKLTLNNVKDKIENLKK